MGNHFSWTDWRVYIPMTIGRVMLHLPYSFSVDDAFRSFQEPSIRSANSRHAKARAAVLCFRGANVLYKSIEILKASLDMDESFSWAKNLSNLMRRDCGWRERKSKPAASSMSRSRPMMARDVDSKYYSMSEKSSEVQLGDE